MTRETWRFENIFDDEMSTNCDVIVILPIYGQFGAIGKPDSRRMACKTYIFINSDFLQKLKTKLKNLYHTSHTIPLSKGTLFDKKDADILQKNADNSTERYISWNYMCAYLRTKFQVYTIAGGGGGGSFFLLQRKANP